MIRSIHLFCLNNNSSTFNVKYHSSFTWRFLVNIPTNYWKLKNKEEKTQSNVFPVSNWPADSSDAVVPRALQLSTNKLMKLLPYTRGVHGLVLSKNKSSSISFLNNLICKGLLKHNVLYRLMTPDSDVAKRLRSKYL